MKKLNQLAFIAAIIVACLFSCKDKTTVKEEPTETEIFKSSLTAEDTTQVLSLCNTCMETLKKGDIDKALSMMQMLNPDSTLSPLSEEKKIQLKKNFKIFPVLDYTIEYFTFNKSGLNDVKYQIEFMKKEPGDPIPNTIGFMFNPIKVNGKWNLAVKEANQEVLSH